MSFAIRKKELVLILLFIISSNIKRIATNFSLNKDNKNKIFNLEDLNSKEILYNKYQNNNNNDKYKDKEIPNINNDKKSLKQKLFLKNNINNINIPNKKLKNSSFSFKEENNLINLIPKENNKPENYQNYPNNNNSPNPNIFLNNSCNQKTCKIPYGICLDSNTCRCGKFYRNLRQINFSNINIKSTEYNYFLLDLLHNNFFSNNLINNIKNLYELNYCEYRRKSQLLAFFLEAIFPIGFGHFYSYRFFHGLLKMTLFFLLFFLIFLMKKFQINKNFSSKMKFQDRKFFEKFLIFFNLVNYLIILVLHVFDIFMFANNSYNDGFGFKLIPWNY